MHPLLLASVLVGSLALSACSPTFNWRETRPQGTALVALLPCKPDRGARLVPLAGQQLELRMLGCDAGGATFAVAHTDIRDAAQAGAALAQWKTVMLGHMRATASQEQPFLLAGASAVPAPVRVAAKGRHPDGSAVAAQAVWFARGSEIFHAVIYADKISPEIADTFFSGLRFP